MLSQAELGKKCGTDAQYVSDVERGRRKLKNIDNDVMVRIATALEMDVDTLLFERFIREVRAQENSGVLLKIAGLIRLLLAGSASPESETRIEIIEDFLRT